MAPEQPTEHLDRLANETCDIGVKKKYYQQNTIREHGVERVEPFVGNVFGAKNVSNVLHTMILCQGLCSCVLLLCINCCATK